MIHPVTIPAATGRGRHGARPGTSTPVNPKRITGSRASAVPCRPTIARPVHMIVWCQPSSILPRLPPSSLVLRARPSVTEIVRSANATRPAARATSHATGTAPAAAAIIPPEPARFASSRVPTSCRPERRRDGSGRSCPSRRRLPGCSPARALAAVASRRARRARRRAPRLQRRSPRDFASQPPGSTRSRGVGACGVMVWPTCGVAGAAGTLRCRPAMAAAPVNAVAASTAANMNTSRRFTVFGSG